MKKNQMIARALEYVSPVWLLAMIIPGFCLLDPLRQDGRLLPMCLAGSALLFCSVFPRIAARKAGSLTAWLAVCAASFAATWLAGMLPGRLGFYGTYKGVFMVGLAVQSLWLIAVSARIRMEEKRRQRAARENDISWREHPVALERPGMYGIAVFAVIYTAALWNHCPVMCDTALASGVIYTGMLLIYRNLSVTDDFLRETKDLENVPAGKMRMLRRFRLLLALAVVLAAALPAAFTAKNRSYRDLRYLKFSTVIDGDRLYFPGYSVPLEEVLPDWVSEPAPAVETPAVFRKLEKILPWIAAAGLAWLALWLIRSCALAFRGAPEENGDIAVSLEPERDVTLREERRNRPRGALTERERVRRHYRRMIRRYRKKNDLPLPGETPSRIEEGTDFPEGFDVKRLHETYEKARYGPG